jgi:hypothetical protein
LAISPDRRSDGEIWTVKIRLLDRTKISLTLQLIIHLEIDQDGENVDDLNIFRINFSTELIHDHVFPFRSKGIFYVGCFVLKAVQRWM